MAESRNDQAPALPGSAAAGRREIAAWCIYDFANSPFTTLVVTFIYSTFFTQVIAADPVSGTAQWSRAVVITAIIVALLSPVLGAFADRGGYRKGMLLATTIICILATASLYFVLPGQVVAALIIFVVANVAYEFGSVFYNAFLPDIAPRNMIGRVSGLGWGLGYFGGLLALVIALVGFVQPEQPWFGLSTELGENVRATNLLTAAWFAVFSIPVFLVVREDKAFISPRGDVARDAWRQLAGTFTEIRKYRQVVRFLFARLIYNDGLVTVFAFGGIYAAETFGFSLAKVLVFGVVINLAAGIGALVMGVMDDRMGAKRTLVLSLVGLIIATLIAVLTRSEPMFWLAGMLIGTFAGPNQSASRSLMGRFVPPERENEFFGFFAFSGKLTAFIGPLLLGWLTVVFDSQRAGVSIVLVLFVIGLVLLHFVDDTHAGADQADDRESASAGMAG